MSSYFHSHVSIRSWSLINVSIPSTRHYYYYYFSSQSSTSLSTSSPSFSLLDLSYCEHQQTTYYSSSGFSILHSSPRFFSSEIIKTPQSLPVHNQNAIPSVVDLSLTDDNDKISLVSSSPVSLSNKKLVIADQNDGIISTTMTTVTSNFYSNVTLLYTSMSTTPEETSRSNMIFIIGCAIGIVIFLMVLYVILKYIRNRAEGSYKIDESVNFATKPSLDDRDHSGCTGKISLSKHYHHENFPIANELNNIDSKEWYV